MFACTPQNGWVIVTRDGRRLGWELPVRACARSEWREKVTLRRLLTHRGGIIGRGKTNPLTACQDLNPREGGGFGGYRNVPGVRAPTFAQVLQGSQALPGLVNSPRVEISYEPGTDTAYSGSGCLVLQQLLQNLRRSSLATWRAHNVLKPAGMVRSTFGLSVPSKLERLAAGHDRQGRPILGLRNRYPESAAAGLYTTPANLARFVIILNQGGIPEPVQRLPRPSGRLRDHDQR